MNKIFMSYEESGYGLTLDVQNQLILIAWFIF